MGLVFSCKASDTRMQVFAKTLVGETLALDVETNETVSNLLPRIHSDAAVEVGLIFAGQVLNDDDVLSEYGVQNGSMLNVVPRLVGGGDGTPAMGKRHKKTHGLCPRCGKRSYHIQKHRCAACGFPAPKIRSYEWSKKVKTPPCTRHWPHEALEVDATPFQEWL